jgi:hypothetical protein
MSKNYRHLIEITRKIFKFFNNLKSLNVKGFGMKPAFEIPCYWSISAFITADRTEEANDEEGIWSILNPLPFMVGPYSFPSFNCPLGETR